jgi:uncharacterized membrane protein YhaH (DUF805 family)
MEWMLLPLKRYADFSGRSRRTEYWMFALFQAIIYIALLILLFVAGVSGTDPYTGDPEFNAFGYLMLAAFAIIALGLIVPNIAVSVRRFHDQDKSGWLYLLGFIPYLGGIIVFVFMVLPGTVGPNQYGNDPKMASNVGDIFE